MLLSSCKATQQLARDPRFVGGQIGMLGVLHTWTRNLFYHPHIHYLVPGGGVGSDGKGWLPARRDFFLPVKALSKPFYAERPSTYRSPKKSGGEHGSFIANLWATGRLLSNIWLPTSTASPSATDACSPSIIVVVWKLPNLPSNTVHQTPANSRPVPSPWSISSSASSSTSCRAAS